jgi:hypothetical protein
MPTLDELKQITTETRKILDAVESRRYERKTALETELRKTLETEFGAELSATKQAYAEARNAEDSEYDRLRIESAKLPFPIGTLVVQWEHIPTWQQRSNGPKMRKTETKGQIEIILPDAVHPDNQASYSRVLIGTVVVRILKANGEPSKRYKAYRAYDCWHTPDWTPQDSQGDSGK